MTEAHRPADRRTFALAWPGAAAACSGLLLALAFPPFNFETLVWVALAPLLAAIWFGGSAARRHRRAFLLGWVAGLVFFLTTFHWITEVTTLGWIVFCPYLALYPALWGWACGLLGTGRPGAGPDLPGEPAPWLSSRRNLALAVAAGIAWVAQEWLRSVVFSGFGWNSLGVALHANLAFIQSAALTGVEGLSFVIVVVNAIAVLTVRRLWDELARGKVRPHYDFNLALALVAVVFAYGVHRLQRPLKDRLITAVLVQPLIPQSQKWDPDFGREIVATLDLLSVAAEDGRADLLLWPEAATPSPALLDPDALEWVTAVRARTATDFLFGTLDGDDEGDYNAAVLLADGRAPQVYRKIHLVPFGEFIPFRNSFPLFAWIVGDLVPGDFRSGGRPVVFEAPRSGVRIGPLICFEDTLPALTRRFVLAGADLLVNLTNDGWFHQSPAAEQHLANARFRAVENARPLVRCANTGVSGVIDRQGRIREALRDENGSPFVRGVRTLSVPVPVAPERTFFTAHGRWFAHACCGLSAVGLVAYGVRRWRPGVPRE